jgi:hypothetical protein
LHGQHDLLVLHTRLESLLLGGSKAVKRVSRLLGCKRSYAPRASIPETVHDGDCVIVDELIWLIVQQAGWIKWDGRSNG